MTKRFEVYRKTFRNTSAITKASSASAQFLGAFYVSMTDDEEESKGSCNVLSITNAASQDAQIWFGMEYTGTIDSNARIYPLPARGTVNLNFEDGIRFYRFRVVDSNTGTDIAAGSITGTMTRVEEA